MTFSDREKFIYYMTAISRSELGRSLDSGTKQQILKYLRDTNCKSISDKDWQEIANDMRIEQDAVISGMMKGAMFTMGGKIGISELAKITKPRMDKTTISKLKELEENALANLSDSNITKEQLESINKLNGDIEEKIKDNFLKHLKKTRPDLDKQ